MNSSRVSLGEMIAGAGGAVLLAAMFLPWFAGRLVGMGRPVPLPTRTGWESYGTVPEFLIAAAGAGAIAVAVAAAGGRRLGLPVEPGALVTIAGAAALAIVAVRLLEPPGPIGVSVPTLDVDSSRKPAAYVALVAAAMVTYGGFRQRQAALAARRRAAAARTASDARRVPFA